MDPITVSALVGGGVSLFNSIYNGSQVDEANRMNRELADLQWSRSLQMQNMQNLYNSPKETMQRFVDAGLNPNLVYGQSGAPASSFIAPSQPQTIPKRSDLDLSNSLSAISTMMSFKKLDAEIENIKANTKNIEANTRSTEVGTDIAVYQRDVLTPITKRLQELDVDAKESANYWFEINQDLAKRLSEVNIDTASQTLKEMINTEEVRKNILYLDQESLEATISDIKIGSTLKWQEYKFLQDTKSLRVEALSISNRLGVDTHVSNVIDASFKNDFHALQIAREKLNNELLKIEKDVKVSAEKREQARFLKECIDGIVSIFNSNTQTAIGLLKKM